MQLLKQSTSVTVKLGPFVDSTDGVTAETALTINQADVRLTKNGGNFAQCNASVGVSHDEYGWYNVPLDNTDTNTLGRLTIAIGVSGALPVFAAYLVVPANTYDALVSGTDSLEVDVVAISGDATAAINLESACDGTGYNLGGGAVVAASVSGSVASVTGAVGSVTGAVGSVTAGVTVTTNNDKASYSLAADQSAVTIGTCTTNTDMVSEPPTAAAIADAVWDETSTGHTDAGKAGSQVWTDIDAILTDTNELQTDDVPGLLAALHDLDAAGVRAAVGLAAANLDTQLGNVPTVAELEARTLLAASYFDPATDKVTLANGAHGGAAAAITLADYSDFQGAGGGGDATAANQTTIITHLADLKGTGFVKDTHSLPQCVTATGFSTFDATSDRVLLANGAHGGAAASLTLADYSDFQGDAAGLSVAEIATACRTETDAALVALGLDHLVAAAVSGSDVTDNSIVARLVSKSATADWDSYSNETDSLEALRDRGDIAWATADATSLAALSGEQEIFLGGEDSETVEYQPRDGSAARTIYAMVEREGYQTDPDSGYGSGPVLKVWVANSDTVGISRDELDTGGDKLNVAVEVGGSMTARPIRRVIEEDPCMLYLELG